MRQEFIIDGYNFLCSRPGARLRPGPGNLERARSAMLGWLASHVENPALVTVVFDASPKGLGVSNSLRFEKYGIAVHFAVGYSSADALIAEMCRSHHFPKQLTVVSDDREVQAVARRCKAAPVGCDAFEKSLKRRAAGKRHPPEPSAKQHGPSEPERRMWQAIFEQEFSRLDEMGKISDEFLREMRDVDPEAKK